MRDNRTRAYTEDDYAIIQDARNRVARAEAANLEHLATYDPAARAAYIADRWTADYGNFEQPNENIRDRIERAPPPPERAPAPDLPEYDGPQGTNPDHVLRTRSGERSTAPRDARGDPSERPGISDLPEYDGRSGSNPDHRVTNEYGRDSVLPPEQRAPATPLPTYTPPQP